MARCTGSERKTPTVATVSGTGPTSPAACAGVTSRGEAVSTKPSASAPCSSAVSTSAAVDNPQIFTKALLPNLDDLIGGRGRGAGIGQVGGGVAARRVGADRHQGPGVIP